MSPWLVIFIALVLIVLFLIRTGIIKPGDGSGGSSGGWGSSGGGGHSTGFGGGGGGSGGGGASGSC